MMVKVGVTGGIGSGKSTFCRALSACGASVIDADSEAKALMTADPEIRAGLIRVFGPDSFLPGGGLNRPYLAREAFEKNRVDELNAVVHPPLFRHLQRRMDEEAAKGFRMVVRDAALLLRYGRPADLDVVILVTAPAAVRLARAASRDGLPEQVIRERMEKQQPDEELKPFADIIIENTGDAAALEARAKALFETLVHHEHRTRPQH